MSTTTQLTADFHFRANKETGYKRPSVSVAFTGLTADGVIEKLNTGDEKVKSLIVDNINGVLQSYIRQFVDNDMEFSQDTLDALVADGKISLEVIANLPKSERSVLTKEDLEAFAKDYIATMPGITGKDERRVAAAAGIFIERYKRHAGDTEVLAVLSEQLEVFVTSAPEEMVAQHERVLTYLTSKAAELLESSQQVTADAL